MPAQQVKATAAQTAAAIKAIEAIHGPPRGANTSASVLAAASASEFAAMKEELKACKEELKGCKVEIAAQKSEIAALKAA